LNNNTVRPVICDGWHFNHYDFTFHVHILRFHWDFFIFYFMRNAFATDFGDFVIGHRGDSK